MEREKGISILISAYGSEKYIEECMNSVQESVEHFKTKYPDVPVEVLIGIDHDKSLLFKIKDIINNYPDYFEIYWMLEKSNWPVVRNTLFYKASKYDTIVTFDSDDIMLKDYICNLYKQVSDTNPFIRAVFKTYVMPDVTYVPYKETGVAGNHFIIKSELVEKMGGWANWTCSADSEFHVRIHNNGFNENEHLIMPLFLLRVHNSSLTNDPKTRNGSEIRTRYKELLKTAKFIPNKKIRPKTVGFKFMF